MYKKQMTFQRVVSYLLLASCALVFIYSLGLMTDLYDYVYPNYRNGKPRVTNGDIYMNMQEFNRTLTVVAIGLILVGLFNFVMGTNSRRKYYIGNYFSIGLTFVCNIGVSVWSIINILDYRAYYLNIDWDALKEILDRQQIEMVKSTFWFDAGFVVFGIFIVVTLLFVANLVMKIMVMKSERRLIGSRKDVRA